MAVAGVLSLSSCSDFLDEAPDNRIDPQNLDQLEKILVGGYSSANYGVMCELSSDNIVDNHYLGYTNMQPLNLMNNQEFAWEDADMESMQDSPTYLWSGAYAAIAAANHVLEKVDEFKAEGKYSSGNDLVELNAISGEAHLIRAYNHFVLVNLFAPQYRGDASSGDQGIPYTTKPETKPGQHYERESVKAVYDKIEADLKIGLENVSDMYYSQPKWHFNTTAANAFAARFYLYKRDYENAELYATKALGTDPSSMLRSNYWGTSYTSLAADASAYFDSSSSNNFLLIPTTSNLFVTVAVGTTSTATRYALNGSGLYGTIYSQAPFYKGNINPAYSSRLYVNGNQRYGCWPSWMYAFFEYSDKVAGIGYYKVLRAEFTAEETLLTRAEARIFLNKIDEAVQDLNTWASAFRTTPGENTWFDMDRKTIESYYNKANMTTATNDPRQYNNLPDLHIDEIFPVAKGKVTAENLPYLWCTLHFRRIETIFTGLRWFDIRRMGIEVTHNIGKTRVETLTFNDKRRAFQVPIEAISSGLEPTDRVGTFDINSSDLVPFIPSVSENDK